MTTRIIFATNSSGTENAAQAIGEFFRAQGHDVTIQHAKDTKVEDVGHDDLTILGSCTWEFFIDDKKHEGQLQQHMRALAAELAGADRSGKKFAVFGLGDSSYTNFCAAADHLEKLVAEMHGDKIGPTLRVDGYFFNLPVNREKVSAWAKEIEQAAT